MSLAALGIAAAGNLAGSQAASMLQGTPELGYKDTQVTRTNQYLDPAQLQQILDSINNAEQTGRTDLLAGQNQALAILSGDTGLIERENAKAQINTQARQQAEAQLRQSIADYFNNPDRARYDIVSRTGKNTDDAFKQLVNDAQLASRVLSNPASIASSGRKQDYWERKQVGANDPRIKLNDDGTVTFSLNPGDSQNKAAQSITIAFKNPELVDSIKNIDQTAQSIAAPLLQQHQTNNPGLYTNQGSNLTAFLKGNQDINLSALNQMAALSGIQGANGQQALSPEEIQARLEQTPGYGFRFDQGQRAVENAGSARGLLESGAILKGLTQFGQGLASQEFAAEHDRLAKLAGLSQSAALMGESQRNQQAQLVSNTGSQLAQLAQNSAQQRGSALLAGGRQSSNSTLSQLFDVNSLQRI